MNNSDSPAFASSKHVPQKDCYGRSIDGEYILATTPGLSKREYIATAAMQGILASNPPYSSNVNFAVLVTHEARKIADALLAELESTNQKEQP